MIFGVVVLLVLAFLKWMRVNIAYVVNNMRMDEKGDAAHVAYK